MDSKTLPVLVIISRRASPGRESELRDWADELCRRAARFPGYITSSVRDTQQKSVTTVIVELGFSSAYQLIAWEESEERLGHLDTADELTQGNPIPLTIEGLEGFADTMRAGERKAPRWHTAPAVWIALYPPAVLSAYLLSPKLHALAIPVQLLITTPLTVATVIWVTLPLVDRLRVAIRRRRP